MKKTLSLDFDGCLMDYSGGWTGYVPEGEPIPGARDFVQWALAHGYEVVISSCRAYTQIGREGIREWLGRHDFPLVPVTCEKPHAVAYIDDRGHRFEGDWEAMKARLDQPVWFDQKAEPRFEG